MTARRIAAVASEAFKLVFILLVVALVGVCLGA
jgi:hypothetical protein